MIFLAQIHQGIERREGARWRQCQIPFGGGLLCCEPLVRTEGNSSIQEPVCLTRWRCCNTGRMLQLWSMIEIDGLIRIAVQNGNEPHWKIIRTPSVWLDTSHFVSSSSDEASLQVDWAFWQFFNFILFFCVAGFQHFGNSCRRQATRFMIRIYQQEVTVTVSGLR